MEFCSQGCLYLRLKHPRMVSCSHPVHIRGKSLLPLLAWQLSRCKVFPFGCLSDVMEVCLLGKLPLQFITAGTNWWSATLVISFWLPHVCGTGSHGLCKTHELLQMLSNLTTERKTSCYKWMYTSEQHDMIMDHFKEQRTARDVLKLSPLVEVIHECKEQAEAADEESKADSLTHLAKWGSIRSIARIHNGACIFNEINQWTPPTMFGLDWYVADERCSAYMLHGLW